MLFSELPAPLATALAARGYAEPTSVQAAVIQDEALGRDLVVSARTGSGKTVAFGLNIGVQLLADDAIIPPPGAPLALVIAPTRELALQVSQELAWLFAPLGLRMTTCVGGMDPSRERRALHSGTHVIVGTPGRLRDHLERGALDLSALQFVVLDEADEMLDMGFRDDLEEILDATPSGRKTLLFSATMPKPIVALAKRYQSDALRISTVDDQQGHVDIAYQAMAVSPSEIEHAVINLLRYHEAETAMLFCATRDNVRHLHATLVERGFTAVALSGEHSQNERNHALQALRDKRARVCVATDVAARGIDVPSLSLVIHVEVPRDAEILQHRSGRTGRAGKKGTAVLIVPYPRRRRVEMMLRSARIDAEWVSVPTPEMIRVQDRDRLLTALMEPIEASDEERELAAKLLESKTPEDIALALVRAHSSRLPGAEEMIDLSSQPRDAGQREPHHRPGFDDTVWFRMDIGGEDESGITIELSPETPREGARENRRARPEQRSGPTHAIRHAPRQEERREHRPRRDEAPRQTYQPEAGHTPREEYQPQTLQQQGERSQGQPRPTLAPRTGDGAGAGKGSYKAKPAFGAKSGFGAKAGFKGKPPFKGGGGAGFKGKPHRKGPRP